MTTKDLMKMIGSNAIVTFEKILVEVEILDGRQNFGRTEYLVRPLSGSGEQWIQDSRMVER